MKVRTLLECNECRQQVARWVELTAIKVSQVATPSGGRQPTLKGAAMRSVNSGSSAKTLNGR